MFDAMMEDVVRQSGGNDARDRKEEWLECFGSAREIAEAHELIGMGRDKSESRRMMRLRMMHQSARRKTSPAPR